METVKKKIFLFTIIQFEARGLWPVADDQGFQTAFDVVRQSRLQGRNDETYQQFDSIINFWSVCSNKYESGVAVSSDVLMFVGEGGRVFHLTPALTQSNLFTGFL